MKISRKNHNDAKEKWGGKIILHKMKNKIPFDTFFGWKDLSMRDTDNCGYCQETGKTCKNCSLISDEGCNKDYYGFVRAMSLKPPNFKKAEKHRKKLFNKIMTDEPNVYDEPGEG